MLYPDLQATEILQDAEMFYTTTANLACVQELIASGAIKKIEQAMHKRLRLLLCHPMVQDTRGIGAMWAVELPNAKLRDRLIDIGEEMAQTETCGLKLLAAGKKSVRLMPPLTISLRDLRFALDLFLVALNKLSDEFDENENSAHRSDI